MSTQRERAAQAHPLCTFLPSDHEQVILLQEMYQRDPHEQPDGHGDDSLSWAGSNLWLFPSLEPPHARGRTFRAESSEDSTSDSSSSQDGNIEAESPHGSPEPASNIDSQLSGPTLCSTDELVSPGSMFGLESQFFWSTTDTDSQFQISDSIFFPGQEDSEQPLFLESQLRCASPQPIKAETVKQEEEEKASFQCCICSRLYNSAKALRYAQHADAYL